MQPLDILEIGFFIIRKSEFWLFIVLFGAFHIARINKNKLRQKSVNLSHNNSQMENNPSKPSTLTFKSILNPEQLKVHSLYEKCGVKIDANTFSKLWKLCELGIPPEATVALMNDIAKYNTK